MKRFTYHLLEQVSELYADASLENVLLLACQHLLDPQKRMFELLFKAGLKPQNCIIVGKNYSTNQGVLEELTEMGCVIAPFSAHFEPQRLFNEWFEEQLYTFLKQVMSVRQLESYHKVIVLDDGGHMHCMVNRLVNDCSNIVGIEQTSSGHNRIQKAGIRFPTISVAQSYHKQLFESPLIGRNGYERIIRHIERRGKGDPNMLVIGLGAIGRQTAGQLFLLHGLRGSVTDLRVGDSRIMEHSAVQLLNIRDRIIPATEAMRRLSEFDVIVGATGSPVLTEEDVERIHPEVSLVSMSSSDNEFPPLPFRRADGKLHEDYYLGKRCLVNGGFPITFYGNRHEIPPQQIELTLALLMIRFMDEASDHLQYLPLVVDQIYNLWQPHEGADRWYRTFANRLT
jgi:S-adenosylhomocysteine hydrolase